MKKIAWLSDLHLDFISDVKMNDFFNDLNELNLDYILIGGDIGTSSQLIEYLKNIRDILNAKIYFVLGNHDFYGSSLNTIKERVKKFSDNNEKIKWLTDIEPIMIDDDLILIGHDGWADARLGTPFESSVDLNDFHKIEELTGLLIHDRVKALNKLGDKAANSIEDKLNKAVNMGNNIIILTHVPPFKESAWYGGLPSGNEWLPWFTSKSFGDVIIKFSENYKDKRFLVLAGHTHGESDVFIKDNLRVITPESEYGVLDIKRIFNKEIFNEFK